MVLRILMVAACLASHVPCATASQWYVAPGGTRSAQGTRDAPWDIESALGGRQNVAPGDTVWLLPGTYKHPNREAGNLGYAVRLQGTHEQPVHVRAVQRQRVTVDPGLAVQTPSTHLWIWDLELLVAENLVRSRRFEESGSHPQTYDRPHGGLNVYAGEGCNYINLLIHHTAQAVSFWSGATDSRLHGCILYDNGWDAPDRGHGHAIYTQNEKGVKTISDCIMSGGYGYTMHAYGSSRAFVDHYVAEGNICYDAGTFLIGGGRPSRDIKVLNNYLHNVRMQIGYSAPYNEDCLVRDNVIVNGSLTVNNFKQVVNEGNLVLARSDPRPADISPQVVIRPNKYDPHRFHVIVLNWAQSPTVNLDLNGLLQKGDSFRLLDPCDCFGAAVAQGPFNYKPIPLPTEGEFAAFVLLRVPREIAKHSR